MNIEDFDKRFLFIITPYEIVTIEECKIYNLLNNYKSYNYDQLANNKFIFQFENKEYAEFFLSDLTEKFELDKKTEDGECEDDKPFININDEKIIKSDDWQCLKYEICEDDTIFLLRYAKNSEVRLKNFMKKLDLRQIITLNSNTRTQNSHLSVKPINRKMVSYDEELDLNDHDTPEIQEKPLSFHDNKAAQKPNNEDENLIEYDYETEIKRTYKQITGGHLSLSKNILDSNSNHQNNSMYNEISNNSDDALNVGHPGLFTKSYRKLHGMCDKGSLPNMGTMVADAFISKNDTSPLKHGLEIDDSDDEFSEILKMHRKKRSTINKSDLRIHLINDRK